MQVYYTVDSIGEGGGKDWKGGVGYVTRKMATEQIPPPSDDNLVLVCGPPPMYKALSGEKKSPKDQGDHEGSCNVVVLVVSVGLACCCNSLDCCPNSRLMRRGAIRAPENNGLHRAAGL